MPSTNVGPTYQVVNPATGEVVETFDHITDADLESTIEAAHQAYSSWRDVPIEERAEVVTRIGKLFAERADDLAVIATEEMGKPLSEAKGEAQFCGQIFRYFATLAGYLEREDVRSFPRGGGDLAAPLDMPFLFIIA